MPIPRVLSKDNQRTVAIAYLAGVQVDPLSEIFQVSDATIRQNVIGKYSYEWNDPVVELFRSTSLQNKAKNGAHLYLALSDERYDVSIPEKDKFKGGVMLFARNILQEAVYDPLWRDIKQRTFLDTIVRSRNGYERLLAAVYKEQTPEAVLDKYWTQGLVREWQRGEQLFSLQRVVSDVEETLLDRIKSGGFGVTSFKAREIEKAITALDERERIVLQRRYTEGSDTYSTIGRLFDISKERSRQIEKKALRRLRLNPIILYLANAYPSDDELFDKAQKDRWKEVIRTELYDEIKREVLTEVLRDYPKANVTEEFPEHWFDNVDELNTSVRTANCLQNAGITKVHEIIERGQGNLLRTRKFGRKSLYEIKEILTEIGLGNYLKNWR